MQKNQDGVYIPEGFANESFTVLVYDNIDRREETLSGANTTHRVNGIIIQRNVTTPLVNNIPLEQPPRKRLCRRSLTGFIENINVDYIHGKRVGPSVPRYFPLLEKAEELLKTQETN